MFKISTNGTEHAVTFFNAPKEVTDFIERINSIRSSLENLTVANQSQRQYAANQRAIANATEHFRDDASVNPNYSLQLAEAILDKIKEHAEIVSATIRSSQLGK